MTEGHSRRDELGWIVAKVNDRILLMCLSEGTYRR